MKRFSFGRFFVAMWIGIIGSYAAPNIKTGLIAIAGCIAAGLWWANED